MKKSYLLVLFVLALAQGFSQNCISLGCAAAHTGITTDGSLLDTVPGAGLGCSSSLPYKQLFWQFFYSPAGGDFTQTYTPTSEGDPLAINYVIFDVGTSAPATVACPLNGIDWSVAACTTDDHPNLPVGPGLFGTTLTTTAGHYYAIAIIIWQGTSTGGDLSYSFDISTPQIGGIDVTPANCPAILPVKLSSFNAKFNNCMIDLDWVAETGSDLKNYQVQYSVDGERFQTIATIAESAQGSDQKYTYQDNSPKQGNTYYRLKMTGENGKFEYSKVIALKLDCNHSSLLVYPNPVNDILNISATSLQNDVTTARLFDNNGKLIYSGKMVNGTNMINMAKFAKGIYLLNLKNNFKTENIKIIK